MVECMTFEALNDEKSGAVVGTPRIGVSQAAKWLVCMVLALMCALWITPCAFAEGEGTLTENITDPQNLLGSNVSAVTDKIKETKQQAGVTVRLLYVESFGTEVKPTQWASGVLESLSPKPNTVLLAVASGDGKLVVVASSNSDAWLSNTKTVDSLSEAATDKLAKSGAQDWSGAAIAMMDQIMLLKKTSTSWSLSKWGIIALICVLVVLIVGTIVFVVVRNSRRRKEAEQDAARAAAGKRTRANRRGHAVGYGTSAKSDRPAKRSRDRRSKGRKKADEPAIETDTVSQADDEGTSAQNVDAAENTTVAGVADVATGETTTVFAEPLSTAGADAKFMPESESNAQPEPDAQHEIAEPEPVKSDSEPAGSEPAEAQSAESQPAESHEAKKKHSGFHLFGKTGKADDEQDGERHGRKRRHGGAGIGEEPKNAAESADSADDNGGSEGSENAEPASTGTAEPLFHAGDSFMPGDGSVDQSVSDDIEAMFARPFIPGTQRPGDED